MTEQDLKKMAIRIDPVNADYIVLDKNIRNVFNWINYYQQENRPDLFIEKHKKRMQEMMERFDSTHLTPANAKVGDGATVNLWSDRHAGTIVRVTRTTVTVRRDKATLNPEFKPNFVIGGFAAHCTNLGDQEYTYEPDEQGDETTIRWSNKYQSYGRPGNLTLSKGRHEFYDYNF